MASTDIMSSDELRAHLYRSLQGKGILDSLKSQLRNRLATELQMSMETSSPSRKRKPASSDVSLATGHSHTISVQVANSIVAEHMKKCGYEYSLSVFLPEGGVALEKLLSVDELLHYLRISPTSPLYQTLKSTDDQCGFLVHLMDTLIETSRPLATAVESKHSAVVQTDASGEGSESHNTKPSVADQLKALDHSYAQKAKEETEKVNHSMLERIDLIQSELEARYTKQLETELSLYRARELAKVRLEEREKYLEEMAREKTQLNQHYQRKLDELRRNEQHIVDQYRLKEQELESSIYSQRQALLSELDSIRRKEEERKRRLELSKKSIDVEEQRLKAMAEELENQRKKLQQVAEEKAQRYKQEIEFNFQTREIELKRQETELQVTHQAASTLKSDNQKLTGQLKEEREKNKHLQALLHEATNRQISSEKQKDSLAQRLNEMADYQSLKQRTLELQRQLTTTSKKLSETKVEYKQRNSEQQQLIKSLQSRLSNPSPELLALQVEIERLQRTHQEEMIVFECDNQELRKQLSIQAEYCQELQKHLDGQMLQLRTAQREVDDLRQILEHLKPTVLQGSNGIGERKMKTEARRPLRTSKKTAKIYPPPHQLHQQHTTVATTAKSIPIHSQSITIAHSGLRASVGDAHTVNFSDASAQFLAETRETFARLEREAEELEKSYQSVRHPASSSSLIAPLFDAMPKPQYTFANHNALDLGPFGLDLQNLSLTSVVTTVPSVQSIHSPVSDETETLSPKYRTSPPIPNDVITSLENVPAAFLPPPAPIPVTSNSQPPAPLLHIPASSTFYSPAPLLPVTSNHPPTAPFTPVTGTNDPLPASLQPVTSTFQACSQFFTPVIIPQTTPPPTSTKPKFNVDKVTMDDTKDDQSSSSSESEVVRVAEKQSIVESTTVVTTTSAKPAAQTQTVVSSQTANGLSVKETSPKISLDNWWKKPVQVDQSPLHTSNNNSKPSGPPDGETDQKSKEDSLKLHTNGAVNLIEEPPAATSSNQLVQTTMESGSEHLSIHVDSGTSDKDAHITGETHESQGSTIAHKSEDDGIDPVMLKYMEIVSQKREEEKREQQKTVAKENIDRDGDSPHGRDFDVPSLSQVSEGFGGLSDDGDPFEDW